jgi:resuscitation-promoting factor RpfA
MSGRHRKPTSTGRTVAKVAVTSAIMGGAGVALAGHAAAAPDSDWDKLAQCESGGNWSINTGNGYYGGLQFSLSTWRAYGGSGMPHKASREEQIRIAKKVQASDGWGAWPACTAKLGLR